MMVVLREGGRKGEEARLTRLGNAEASLFPIVLPRSRPPRFPCSSLLSLFLSHL